MADVMVHKGDSVGWHMRARVSLELRDTMGAHRRGRRSWKNDEGLKMIYPLLDGNMTVKNIQV